MSPSVLDGSLIFENIQHRTQPVPEIFSPPTASSGTNSSSRKRHFIGIVRGETEPICSLEKADRMLRLALAAYESQEMGQGVKLTETA